MASQFFRRSLILLTLLASAAIQVSASQKTIKPLVITSTEIEQCSPVLKLGALKDEIEGQQSNLTRQVFSVLFPFANPGWNAVLATFYISSVPNFILAFIPAQVNGETLNLMTAFATGGLLSDVLLHLVPHSFMGEHQGPGVQFILVEEKRNILIGLSIFGGFAAFFAMEKIMRVLGGDEGAAHSHSHSHSPDLDKSSGSSTAISTKHGHDGIRSRVSLTTKEDMHDVPAPDQKAKGASKLTAYLNLFGDFVHNITDGLAMAASFYASPAIGATTTLACFAHEIPHEISDYSILIRSGFTKSQAMQSQFLTAVGAFIGTFMGIALHHLSGSSDGAQHSQIDLAAAVRGDASGILGTTTQISDLVIPFVAGGFLYIASVTVVPTLLEESRSAKQAMKEFGAMGVGVFCMMMVAWNE